MTNLNQNSVIRLYRQAIENYNQKLDVLAAAELGFDSRMSGVTALFFGSLLFRLHWPVIHLFSGQFVFIRVPGELERIPSDFGQETESSLEDDPPPANHGARAALATDY